MDNMQENGTGMLPEEQGTAPAENKPRPWYKLPLITVPAVIALLAMLYVLVVAAFQATHRASLFDGLWGGPYIGVHRFRTLFTYDSVWKALKNTALARLLTLAVCGSLAAGMCALCRKMKKPGTILTVACLWLVPAAIPTVAAAWAARSAIIALKLVDNSVLYLAGAGLQTLGIFCFACGLFAYLKKNPFAGLQTAVLVWLLANLTTSAVCLYGIGFPYTYTLDDIIIKQMYLTSQDYTTSSVYSVIKVVLQVLIGIIPAVLLCGCARKDAGRGLKTTGGEKMLIPAAVACALLALLAFNLTRTIEDEWFRASANSLVIAVAGGAFGGLLAWSFVRLLERVSRGLYGVVSLVLSAAMSCMAALYLLAVSNRLLVGSVVPQVLYAAFDWRIILLAVILGFVLRSHTAKRPVSLALALMLLAGACTWAQFGYALFYESKDNMTMGALFLALKTVKRISKYPVYRIMLLTVLPPLLMGVGAAFRMRRAFAELPEKE